MDRSTRQAHRDFAADDVHTPGLLRQRIREGKRAANLRCLDCGNSTLKAHFGIACTNCQGTGLRPYTDGVALAAYVGDEAAAALGLLDWDGMGRAVSDDMSAWLSGLASRWPEAMLPAALAVGWEALKEARECPACYGSGCFDPDDDPRECLNCDSTGVVLVLEEAGHVLTAAQAYLDDRTDENLMAWLNAALGPEWLPVPSTNHCFTVARAPLTDEQKRRVIREALVPWALEVS